MAIKKTWGWGRKRCNIVLERAVAEHFICAKKRITANFFHVFSTFSECHANVLRMFFTISILNYNIQAFSILFLICLAKNLGGGSKKCNTVLERAVAEHLLRVG